ncbi:hypothetical protein [Roseimaritima sediminicola]|uniref:hypothetical protein n=1 Tax=Roseimaritima sediminicola TaxID=2662066 RepID=UPI0012984554|nr:hypothetical protein [Roseimaritima sediminicola]
MTDLKNPRVILAKGFLFLLLGGLAVVILIARVPRLDVAVLVAIAIWSFCRFYYFAFYVIQHYVDPGYRFAGLMDFARYAIRRRRK